jgi:hypothetical protein
LDSFTQTDKLVENKIATKTDSFAQTEAINIGTSTESEASKKRIETEKSLKYIKQKPKTLFKKKKKF